jgi:hypothetical protein
MLRFVARVLIARQHDFCRTRTSDRCTRRRSRLPRGKPDLSRLDRCNADKLSPSKRRLLPCPNAPFYPLGKALCHRLFHRSTAVAEPDRHWPPRSRSIFVTLGLLGSGAQTKTPTGCCANIFHAEPICPCTARPSSAPSQGGSMKGPERPCYIKPQQTSSQSVLQRSVEPAAKAGIPWSELLIQSRHLTTHRRSPCAVVRSCRYTASR